MITCYEKLRYIEQVSQSAVPSVTCEQLDKLKFVLHIK